MTKENKEELDETPEILQEVADACMLSLGSTKKTKVVEVLPDEEENAILVLC